ncbi:type I-E CRISPR-associated protein Cse1/CasA [Microbulbifer sp. ZKSA004]|uniref:type I-E CRISPR-associated protein Cse1/CasA n=1 Tax=Microbulbifer sp. ZKSA004 TaxID=3243389 RepID=UPI0040394F6B
MNLVEDSWLPIIRRCGMQERIAPWQIAEVDNPIVDICTVRPDFRGALFQFLIGLLQTAFAPESVDDWGGYWKKAPTEETLISRLQCYVPSFELFQESGPAFMQDLELRDGESKSIAALLIEAPGSKTCRDNQDLFIKSGRVQGVCPSCAASALFTLQINAPSGGVGHRTSLRGGGPLTTLIMPEAEDANLWQKLWLNILPQEEFGARSESSDSCIFPWLVPSRLSDKQGSSTSPNDTHPLQMYWGMPRRIRFHIPREGKGYCDLCGEQTNQLIREYTTKNYGINYEGPWIHPLTPYRCDPKKKAPPLSLKGQQSGLGYRHWLGLMWNDHSNGDEASRVVRLFHEEYAEILEELDLNVDVRLWGFGYDMDNMKARCWYEQEMPVLPISPEYRSLFIQLAGQLLTAAKDTLKELRFRVKAAWFNNPNEAKGDFSFVDQAFWQATESQFYHSLKQLSLESKKSQFTPAPVAIAWAHTLKKTAFAQFDHWSMEGSAEDLKLQRVTRARRLLRNKLASLASLKTLDNTAKVEQQQEEL